MRLGDAAGATGCNQALDRIEVVLSPEARKEREQLMSNIDLLKCLTVDVSMHRSLSISMHASRCTRPSRLLSLSHLQQKQAYVACLRELRCAARSDDQVTRFFASSEPSTGLPTSPSSAASPEKRKTASSGVPSRSARRQRRPRRSCVKIQRG